MRSLSALARDVEGRFHGKDADVAHTLVRFCDEAVEDNHLRRQGFSPRPWSLSRSTIEVKSCPDCAETILAKANVCRFCGYRFASVGIDRS